MAKKKSMAEKILVVDDCEDMALDAVETLNSAGYEAVYALDGEEGLRKSQENKQDLILTDMNMPGMSGYDLAKKLRRIDYKGPIIISTSYDIVILNMNYPDIKNYVSGFLEKICSKEELLETVRSALHTSRSQ